MSWQRRIAWICSLRCFFQKDQGFFLWTQWSRDMHQSQVLPIGISEVLEQAACFLSLVRRGVTLCLLSLALSQTLHFRTPSPFKSCSQATSRWGPPALSSQRQCALLFPTTPRSSFFPILYLQGATWIYMVVSCLPLLCRRVGVSRGEVWGLFFLKGDLRKLNGIWITKKNFPVEILV